MIDEYNDPIAWQAVNGFSQKIPDSELRQRLVQYFVKNNKAKYSEINAAISGGDIKLAHRLVHTLKTNAGQLGLSNLQIAAEAVEWQLRDGVTILEPEQMETLERELNVALEELWPQVVEPAPPIQTNPLDADEIQKIIADVMPLLEIGSPECMKYIKSLRRIQGGEELVRLIEDMDFDVALAELKKRITNETNNL